MGHLPGSELLATERWIHAPEREPAPQARRRGHAGAARRGSGPCTELDASFIARPALSERTRRHGTPRLGLVESLGARVSGAGPSGRLEAEQAAGTVDQRTESVR